VVSSGITFIPSFVKSTVPKVEMDTYTEAADDLINLLFLLKKEGRLKRQEKFSFIDNIKHQCHS
jgi:hypothetical protein